MGIMIENGKEIDRISLLLGLYDVIITKVVSIKQLFACLSDNFENPTFSIDDIEAVLEKESDYSYFMENYRGRMNDIKISDKEDIIKRMWEYETQMAEDIRDKSLKEFLLNKLDN
jgi:hypothetical protein